jgi:hypothetical protein
MGKSLLEWQRGTAVGQAVVDMSGRAKGQTDGPLFQLEAVPLPITHVDFTFDARELALSRNGGQPLDTFMASEAGRRIGEAVEKTLIGVETGITYGTASNYDNTPTVYGYINHPDILTSSLTAADGNNPDVVLGEMLRDLDALRAKNFFGPFMVYTANDFDRYMDSDYWVGDEADGVVAPARTLRDRIKAIPDVVDVKRLDYLTDSLSWIIISMEPDTIQAVTGMALKTLRWTSEGGMGVHFKVMAIMVPRIRSKHIGTDQTNAAATAPILYGT